MNLLSVLLINGGVIVTMMLALWAVSLRRRDVSIVDIFWGLGFVLIAWTTCLTTADGARAEVAPDRTDHGVGPAAVRLPGLAKSRQAGGLPVSGHARGLRRAVSLAQPVPRVRIAGRHHVDRRDADPGAANRRPPPGTGWTPWAF